MTIVDRNNGQSITKVVTVTKKVTKHDVKNTTTVTYIVKLEETGDELGTYPNLNEARVAIGKVLRHPEPTSKPKSAFHGPAKGGSAPVKKTPKVVK